MALSVPQENELGQEMYIIERGAVQLSRFKIAPAGAPPLDLLGP